VYCIAPEYLRNARCLSLGINAGVGDDESNGSGGRQGSKVFDVEKERPIKHVRSTPNPYVDRGGLGGYAIVLSNIDKNEPWEQCLVTGRPAPR
jgi:hypothetical protein